MPFRDIVGHRRVVGLLARSIRRDTLPPSLILAGPAGAGKRRTAIAAAQAINCLAPRLSDDSIDACGACTACTRIARGVHPDLLVVEPGDSGSIKIDRVRDVVERAGYRPFEGKRRIVVVDEADALVAAAQNALLKTLEEPPPSSIFFLITARPDMLLPTVRSRCPQLRFSMPGGGDLDREARAVAERVLVHAAKTDVPAQRIEAARELLEGAGADPRSDREQLAGHLRAMASLLRDVELVAVRADIGGLANPDARPVLERLTAAYKGERGLRAFGAVDQALAALDRNAGVKIVADWVVLNL
jgi:DNA polymerase-3 subunit delta'